MRVTDEIQAIRASTAGALSSTDSFPQSEWCRWTNNDYASSPGVAVRRVYFDIPASGAGESGTNYNESTFGYDIMSRTVREKSPGGTITRYVNHPNNWILSIWVGTNDAGANDTDPTGGGNPNNNMAPIQINQFDGGDGGGDGNLTQETLPVDSNAENNRITSYEYDWRDREAQSQSTDGTYTIITTSNYDNQDNVTIISEYQSSVADETLINLAKMSFDVQNRRYQSQRFAVDIDDEGAVGPALTSLTYFDPIGRIARSVPIGGGFQAVIYDAVSRPCFIYNGWGGTIDSGNPGNVDDATVIEQIEYSYDDASNLIASTKRQRFSEATGSGALQSPTIQPEARVYHTAMYPDAIGRNVAEANYGTNGGLAWTRADLIPISSPTTLVTNSVFDSAGNLVTVTDAMGTTSTSTYDEAGRVIVMVENYSPGNEAPDANKTTTTTYNGDNNVVSVTIENVSTGNQTTRWIYGVTPDKGSTLSSAAMVYEMRGPAGGWHETYSYNRQGNKIGMMDRTKTKHLYTYDLAGRKIGDQVTAFGPQVDTSVQMINTSYEVRGMVQTVSSYGSGDVLLNQTLNLYNSFSQLVTEYQSHDGAVDISTIPSVGYDYADGTANTIRRIRTDYPGAGTQIGVSYASADANALSRPDGLEKGGAAICSYNYLGMNVFVGVNYVAASGLLWTAETGGTGEAGDVYTALDRFGRLIETLWQTGDAVQVHSKYGRNQFNGVVWRQDLQAATLGVTTNDNFYSYDELYQVPENQRGQLVGAGPGYTGITNLQQQESFGFDSTGNWSSYNSLNPANMQTRAHNVANEITQIAASAGNISPVYDGAGNMRTLPVNPGQSRRQYSLTWDAWNRLVKVTQATNIVATYSYDGLSRRTTKTTSIESRNYYYSDNWQVLEERSGDSGAVLDCQYVWGIQNRWDLFQRLRTTDGEELNEQIFVLTDYLDPVAIADSTGSVSERYRYDTFGAPQVLTPDFLERSSSLFAWTFLFHREFLDSDSSLYNYGYRYYSSSLGRWLSVDPLGLGAGLNLYAFVSNRPTSLYDILGLDDCADEKRALRVAKRQYAAATEQHAADNQALQDAFTQKSDDESRLKFAIAAAVFACAGVSKTKGFDKAVATTACLGASAEATRLAIRALDDEIKIDQDRKAVQQDVKLDADARAALLKARAKLRACLSNRKQACAATGRGNHV